VAYPILVGAIYGIAARSGNVIASEAKQSILSSRGEMDCFVASLAMTVITNTD
jgi:hypothetical protein